MTKNTMLKTLVFAAVLLLATGAYAVNTITLRDAAMVNGKQLPAGQYEVKISGSGPVADVTFLRGKTEVATAKAKLKELGKKAAFNSVTLSQNPDGSRTVTNIEFSGKTQSLEIQSGGQDTEMSAGK